MKKIIIKSFIALFAIAFLIFGAVGLDITAKADESSIASGTAGENINWVLDADGTLTISGYGEFDFEWYAPDWLEYDEKITSVRIEEGIDNIPDTLLSSLNYAKKIYIPSTVTYIANLAFDNSFAIEEFIVSEENEYYKSENGILYTKDGLAIVKFPTASPITEFTVPDDVLFIRNEAFACSRTLKVINIGENVLEIGNNAFYNSFIEKVNFESVTDSILSCVFSYVHITSFVVPDTVEYIGSSAFFAIESLETLVIGSGVKKIGSYLVYRTDALSTIHYHGTAESWNDIIIDENNEDLFEKEIHFVSYKEGYDATCAEGHTGGLYCESCDEYVSGEAISSVTDHTPGEATNVVNEPASCYEYGYCYAEYYCTVCEEFLYDTLQVTDAATGHNFVSGVCTACGNECEHIDENYDGACDACEKSDAFEYAFVQIDTSYTVIVNDGDTFDEIVIFRPEESGYYVITSGTSVNDVDPYVKVCSESGYELGVDDDSGEGYNFSYEFKASAGEAYIIFLKEWNGAYCEYSYTLAKSYRIVHQPTSERPEVSLSYDIASSYQWYEYKLGEEITSENANVVNLHGEGSAYLEDKGWTGDFWAEGEGSFFSIELKAGDAIYLDFGHSIDGETGIWGLNTNDVIFLDSDEKYAEGKLIFVAPFDDVFEIYSYSVTENTYLRAYLLEKAELVGETTSELKTFRLGSMYNCEVLVGENVLVSDVFICDYAVIHTPTSDEPYIKVNVGEAIYQWSEVVFGGEITDKTGSIVDWGRGEVSSYTEGEGWTGILDMYGEDLCYDFVTISLTKGQRVILIVEGNYYDGIGLYDYATERGLYNAYEEDGLGFIVFEIEADGDYTVYTYSTDGSARVKIYLEIDSEKIEGATNDTYYAEADGYYVYRVTFENGAGYSGMVYLSAHSHTDEDVDYVCDECKAELPGKPAEGGNTGNPDDNTGSGSSGAGSTGDDGETDGDNSGASSEMPLTTKIVIAAMVVSLLAVLAIVFIVIKKKR